MTFTEELYQHISSLYSGMTVRGFSKLCGKSEGYYGSMKAQNLELATSAITHLIEELEQRKMMFISFNVPFWLIGCRSCKVAPLLINFLLCSLQLPPLPFNSV